MCCLHYHSLASGCISLSSPPAINIHSVLNIRYAKFLPTCSYDTGEGRRFFSFAWFPVTNHPPVSQATGYKSLYQLANKGLIRLFMTTPSLVPSKEGWLINPPWRIPKNKKSACCAGKGHGFAVWETGVQIPPTSWGKRSSSQVP